MLSHRLQLAVAAVIDRPAIVMDVKGAFQDGKIEEKVFVRQASGFEINDCEWRALIMKLMNALYGLR